MSRVLVVVVICAITFVLVGLSSSPTLLLGFGLELRCGDLPASKEQPQPFTLSLGSEVVRYLSLKTLGKSKIGAKGVERGVFVAWELLGRSWESCA